MRILFFSESFGDATFINNQVEQIAAKHDVFYLCHNICGPEIDKVEVTEIKLRYPMLISKFRDRLEMHQCYLTFFNRSFSKALKSQVDRFQPDIIHLQFGYEALRFLDNYSPTVPVIIHFRGYDASRMLENRAYRAALGKYLSRPNIWPVSVCNYLINNLESYGVKSYRKAKVVYSNTDIEFFKRSDESMPPVDVFTLVQVSSFREKKGHQYTLQALHKYIQMSGRRDIRCIMTGKCEGPAYLNVGESVKNLGLQDIVVFEGQTNPEQTRDLLQNAHCAILHSVTAADGDQEGIPNALMEAMAMELPIISSLHAGIPELIEGELAVSLVPERDVEAYAQALVELRENWRLAPENRTRIQQRFSRGTFARNIFSIYEDLVGEDGA